jgi:hypothetical protein
MMSGAVQIQQTLQTVVTVDHTTVQIVQSDVAKRPPSSGTSGRKSGGSTGSTVMIIHSGLLPEVWNASISFKRLLIFLL